MHQRGQFQSSLCPENVFGTREMEEVVHELVAELPIMACTEISQKFRAESSSGMRFMRQLNLDLPSNQPERDSSEFWD